MALAGYNLKPITLPPDTRMRLGGVLTELVRDLESVHAHHFDNIRVWWRWYEAEPATRRKNTPWPNASNVVAPVIRTQADARTAQDFSMIWGTKDKLYSGKSQNEDFTTRYLAPVMDFGNWAIDAEVHPFWTILDWIHERNVLGCSVFSVSYDERKRYVFAPGSKRPQEVVMRRGVRWTHHPAETIMWEPGIPIRESDRVVVQTLRTAGDLSRLLNEEEGYDRDAILKLMDFPHFHGSPGAQVRSEKETRAGLDPSANVSYRRIYDTRVLWLDWPTIGGLGVKGIQDLAVVEEEETGERTRVPLIVELAPDTQAILRVLPNPYLMADGNPWFDAYYRRQVGYARGIGLAKILEGTQRAQSTIVNQSIDSRTLQNSIPFKTTDANLKGRPITPGQGLHLSSMQDAEPFPIPSGNPFDLALANLMQVWAERGGGITDPMIGRESRSGGHPSPATNYMGQLRQGQMMGSVPTFILDEQLAAAGLYTLSLYQQFDTDESGRLVRVFGEEDAARIREWLFPNDMSLVGNLQLKLTALSDNNPQLVTQKNMVISQMTQMYFANILKLVQALSTPSVPEPVKKAAIHAVKVIGDTYQQFLEGNDYDAAYEAVLRLDDGDMNAIARLQQIAQQAGGAQPPGGQPGTGGPGPGAVLAGQPGAGPAAEPPAGAMVPSEAGTPDLS